MKEILTRLFPLTLALCLALSACGGGGEQPFDPDTATAALLESEAFSDALDTVDTDAACDVYGIDAATVTGCTAYFSLSAGAEELAVLTLKDTEAAEAAKTALDKRVADQKSALKDYQPDEVSKLDAAIVERRGTSVLLVVAADGAAAQAVIDTLGG